MSRMDQPEGRRERDMMFQDSVPVLYTVRSFFDSFPKVRFAGRNYRIRTEQMENPAERSKIR